MSAWIFNHRVIWLVSWIVFWVAADQGTKIWAQGALTEKREVVRPREVADPSAADGSGTRLAEERVTEHVAVRTIEVIPSFLNWKYAENRAAAFSLTQSIPEGARRPLLLTVSIFACVLICVWYLRLRVADGLLMTSFVLIIAGALGNFIDRARLGYVIDFIDVYVAHDGLAAWLRAPHTVPVLGIQVRLSDHWPTFNIADSCIVSGAIGVIIRTIKPLPGTDGTEQA
jgi:signal peptidase II